MSKEADLIIIGAGPGGYRAAEYAAKQGLKVVIFEDADVGGTCLNVGCIPTKTYVHSATFAEARERMAQVVTQLRQGVEGILSHPNITLVREKGAFIDASTVNGYTAPHIIIATGSETKWLPIPGTDDPRVVDSTGLLQLDTLPRRLAIIGAGVIGMEFASVFHRFGSEVTVIEYLKECLPALDSDIAKRLRKQMEKEGITFHMQCGVKQIADGEVFFEDKKGNTQSVEADIILMATGRKPRTEGLNLEALGLTLSPNAPLPADPTTFLIPPSSFLQNLLPRRCQRKADAGSCSRDAGSPHREPDSRQGGCDRFQHHASSHFHISRSRLRRTHGRSVERTRCCLCLQEVLLAS